MNNRQLSTGPKEVRERELLVRKLQADLRRFEQIPPNRREVECADEGEQVCRALLHELGAETER